MAVDKVIVSGNLGEFRGGQTLTDRREIALYYRLSVNEGADEPTTLTTDEILEIIDNVDVSECDGDPSDIDVLRTEALEMSAPKQAA